MRSTDVPIHGIAVVGARPGVAFKTGEIILKRLDMRGIFEEEDLWFNHISILSFVPRKKTYSAISIETLQLR